jgi:hypothetical protein
MPHLIDLFIYGCILLNVSVSLGNIRLRLIVVIVAYEVLNGVVREQLLEFLIKLRSEGFVWGYNQAWFLDVCYNVGNGEGLSGAGHAEQDLMGEPSFEALSKGINRVLLITLRFEWRYQLERSKPRQR